MSEHSSQPSHSFGTTACPNRTDIQSAPNPQKATLSCFVRIRAGLDPRFVEFDFAIGDPDLFVELIMPTDAFDQFCYQNNVEFIDQETAQHIDHQQTRWRYSDLATL